MNKTLRLSFSLQNAYRVNTILYAIKQIPLLKRLLPDSLYACAGLKIFGQVLAVLWEIGTFFLGKFLYFLTMVVGVGVLYEQAPTEAAFAHILIFLTFLGAFLNTYLFNPTRDKYYAVILLRMDARAYALTNYFYSLVKVVVGFLPFTLLFGLLAGAPGLAVPAPALLCRGVQAGGCGRLPLGLRAPGQRAQREQAEPDRLEHRRRAVPCGLCAPGRWAGCCRCRSRRASCCWASSRAR